MHASYYRRLRINHRYRYKVYVYGINHRWLAIFDLPVDMSADQYIKRKRRYFFLRKQFSHDAFYQNFFTEIYVTANLCKKMCVSFAKGRSLCPVEKKQAELLPNCNNDILILKRK